MTINAENLKEALIAGVSEYQRKLGREDLILEKKIMMMLDNDNIAANEKSLLMLTRAIFCLGSNKQLGQCVKDAMEKSDVFDRKLLRDLHNGSVAKLSAGCGYASSPFQMQTVKSAVETLFDEEIARLNEAEPLIYSRAIGVKNYLSDNNAGLEDFCVDICSPHPISSFDSPEQLQVAANVIDPDLKLGEKLPDGFAHATNKYPDGEPVEMRPMKR